MNAKSQLLQTLPAERAEWESLLASVAEESMDVPGAAGHWSVKDIISHITAYEYWLVEWLTAAAQNIFPAASPLDDADVERRNACVYELTHSLSTRQVLEAAQQDFEALLKVMVDLPDQYFDDPPSAEWFMKPYWSKMKTVPEAVLNLSTDHYEEHIPALQAWIENQRSKK